MNEPREVLIQTFQDQFHEQPKLFHAPGRINLIGEHTDYNDGFVMPFAIDRGITLAVSPRSDRLLIVHSIEFRESIQIDLKLPERRASGNWSDYVEGIARCLLERGCKVTGANIVISSSISIGSGLSSSAALEIALAFSLLSLNDQYLDPLDVVLLAQEAEHRYVGTLSGIMDQFVAMFGRRNNCLLIDCRSLQYRALSLQSLQAAFVVCNTGIQHQLASSEYNRRRFECEEGLRQIQNSIHSAISLRDVSYKEFSRLENTISEPFRRRCRHVITENLRTMDAASTLEAGDLCGLGELMYASHASLRMDYEVTCAELDALVDVAHKVPGVFGARMTGGGFGGCTINLMKHGAVSDFTRTTQKAYHERFGSVPDIFEVHPSGGVRQVLTIE
jgi:galactokinase